MPNSKLSVYIYTGYLLGCIPGLLLFFFLIIIYSSLQGTQHLHHYLRALTFHPTTFSNIKALANKIIILPVFTPVG